MRITPTNVALALFALLACAAAIVSYISGAGEDGRETTRAAVTAPADSTAPSDADAGEARVEPGARIAVADVNRVLVECEAGSDAMGALSAMNERFLAQVNVLRDKLEQRETEDNYNRLQDTAALLQATIAAEQERISALLMEHLGVLMAQALEQGDFDLILDASQVQAYDASLDLTGDLVSAMNAESINIAEGVEQSEAAQAMGNATDIEGWAEYVEALMQTKGALAAAAEANATAAAAAEAAAEANATAANATEILDANATAANATEILDANATEANATEILEANATEALDVNATQADPAHEALPAGN